MNLAVKRAPPSNSLLKDGWGMLVSPNISGALSFLIRGELQVPLCFYTFIRAKITRTSFQLAIELEKGFQLFVVMIV